MTFAQLSPASMEKIAKTGLITTGDLAKIAGVAPRTASKWIDAYFDQYKILQTRSEWNELQQLARRNNPEFEKRIAPLKFGEKQEELGIITRVVLEGAKPPYRVPGSLDRRIPVATVVALLKAANMAHALEGLDALPSLPTGQPGIIFASKSRPTYTQELRQQLNGSDYCCASTSTATDTIYMIGEMKRQNGSYPVVMVDSSMGMDEITSIGRCYGKDVPLIATISSKDPVDNLSNFVKLFERTREGKLSLPQIEELATLVRENQFWEDQKLARTV